MVMTHDELLAEIDEAIEMAVYEERLGCGGGWSRGAKALRAVVELHKQDKDNFCVHCSAIDEFPERYPCYIIKIIEKELQ